MPTILFDIPEQEDPETGIPDRIVHGCDYMRFQPDKLEFYYSFLDYFWTIDGECIHARCSIEGGQGALGWTVVN